MKLSQLIAKMTADLEANGDTENVSLGLTVTKSDGKKYRLDAVITEDNDVEVIRDANFTNGMACIVADHIGSLEVQLSDEEQAARGQLLAETFLLKKDPEHKDRFKTNSGTKTAIGVFATARRYIQEGQ